MQRVLPDPSVKDRIAKLCVGLAADCDAPEDSVERLMSANLAGAQTLPFNITTGRDNNRDNQYWDRPSLANPGDPGAIVTRFGTFNPNPLPGDLIIPRNYGQSPGAFTANLSVSKTFGFGLKNR